MRVRWTTDAADDLERICDYIAETNPHSARRVARSIVEGIAFAPSRIGGAADASKVPESLFLLHCRSWPYTR